MLVEASDWLSRRSSSAADWPVSTLLELKGETRISVVLPARDEQDTVGAIVSAIRRELTPLVDEIVVIDSRSIDDTAAVAAAAGAKVFSQDSILPRLPSLSGKGEALWKSLAVTTGDLLVFVDADLLNFSSSFVTGLLGPLLSDPTVSYVKACYDRPYNGSESDSEAFAGGGRVTELVARPLINMHWPELAGVIQPLSGEYAGRRSLLERVPFATGYGVELGLLLDTVALCGLDALAQVDLGVRVHSHHSTEALGAMASQIMQTAWSRLERQGLMMPFSKPSPDLTQFRRTPLGYVPDDRDASVGERPPMIEIPEYATLQPR